MGDGSQGKEDMGEWSKECLEGIWRRVSVSNRFEVYLCHSPLETCTFYHEFYINERNKCIYLANMETFLFLEWID